MPPKKAKPHADDDLDSTPYTTRKLTQNLGVEDLNLPRSMVARLAKGVLPPNTQVQKDAILAISKSATVFVNYLASHANDRATLNNKKTVQPEDVLEALRELEYGEMVESAQEEEKRFAAMLNEKRNDYRRRVREQKAEADKSDIKADGDANVPTANGTTQHTDEEPAAKKPRLLNGATDANDDSMMNDPEEGDDTIDENEEDEAEVDGDEGDEDEEPSGEEEFHDAQEEDEEEVGERHVIEIEEEEESGSE